MQLQLWIQPLICAPGTYYCWVARGNVHSNLAQDFWYMTNAAGIEHRTTGCRVQRPNCSATLSTSKSNASVQINTSETKIKCLQIQCIAPVYSVNIPNTHTKISACFFDRHPTTFNYALTHSTCAFMAATDCSCQVNETGEWPPFMIMAATRKPDPSLIPYFEHQIACFSVS